jgi:coiled-coil domain-containing protein 12
MSSQASLSAAVDDRKARLAKLKSLKRKQPSPSDDDHDMSTITHSGGAEESSHDPSPPSRDVARLHISGRNYDPETRGPKLGFEAPPVEGPTLEDKAAELEAEVRRKAEEEAAADRGIDLFKLQPKKPNWDLKRELNRKLEILNVRTDNAIARLVRERLEAKKAAASASGAGKKTEGAAGETDGGLEGTAIVEGLRMREREEAEEERRDREESE